MMLAASPLPLEELEVAYLKPIEAMRSFDTWAELNLSPGDQAPDTPSLADVPIESPEAPPARHGFAWLKTQDPQLHAHWRKFTDVFVDLYDWGYKLPNGVKPRANTKEALNYWFDRDIPANAKTRQGAPRRPRRLSLRRMEAASRGETAYVTTHPFSGWGLLALDIDDHAGDAGDAAEVFQFANALLVRPELAEMGATLYGQPSTHGRGYHGYFFVRFDPSDVEGFRGVCSQFEKTIAEVVADHGFRAKVELKGVPGIMAPNGIYAKMSGDLIKFPILRDAGDIRQFLYHTPWFSPDRLLEVIQPFRPATPDVPISIYEGGGDEEGPPEITPDVPISIYEGGGRGAARQPQARRPSPIVNRYGNKDTATPTVEKSTTPPHRRMGDCGRRLSRQLRRPATPEEILAQYEAEGLHTGTDDDGNRLLLAQKTADWIASHWRDTRTFDPATYMPIIQAHVTPEIRQRTKQRNRTAFDDAQLAAVLHAITISGTTRHPTPSYQFTCPNNSLAAMMATLGYPLDGPESETARKRLAAIKHTLTDAGLIVELDGGRWAFGHGHGRGKKYGLGPNHPRHAEYLALLNS